jgi:hypothetical protein
LTFKVQERWPNVNEVLKAVKEAREEFGKQLAERVLEAYGQLLRDRLAQPVHPAMKKGLGSHSALGGTGKCRSRSFKKAGYRSEPRRLRTELGLLEFSVGYVECVRCGRKLSPIVELIAEKKGQRRTGGLERLVQEAISETSYQRGCDQVSEYCSVPLPKSTAHRWAAELAPMSRCSRKQVKTLYADGTGFKRWPGRRGEVLVVLGVTDRGQIQPIGSWCGRRWEETVSEIKARLKAPKPTTLVVDGEVGLQERLGGLCRKIQRCQWHFTRDMYFLMAHDKAPSAERYEARKKVAGVMGIAIPETDYEHVTEEDKQQLKERVLESRRSLQDLASEVHSKGYLHTASYIRRAMNKLFTNVDYWLETGIMSPKTTGVIEGVIRELGRRIKKLGWNWSDAGAQRITEMVLMRHFDAEEWNKFWCHKLDLQQRCSIEILRWKSAWT